MDRIPILKMGSCLLVTIQVDLEDQTALGLQDDLSRMISTTGAKGVLIDISALEIVDSFIGRMPLMMHSAPISRMAVTVFSRCWATSVSTVGTPVM